ncbi:Spy/CpxP family protein refolding chaperone [Alteromonas ponticola]|uniref:DUF3106 domain-containing protein n=1 Tax=Alteromonas ponticola TaxID=2720613 RepID=A0ABX1R360_9ALTE|nr:Spy/CpxP family protein refolding chaperone [Alteromonas ponticola]NMH60076.1 hypothetical protein [Alteromonas ponticola]
MKKLILVTLFTTALSGTAIEVFAHGGKMVSEDKSFRVYQKLNLSDDQKNTIKELTASFRQAHPPVTRESRPSKMPSLQQPFDEEAFTSHFLQRNPDKAHQHLEHAQLQHAIFHVFTDAQQLKFVQLQNKRKAKMHFWRTKKIERTLDTLNLDPGQREQISAMRDEHDQHRKVMSSQMEDYYQQRRDIIQQTVFDDNQWLALETKYQDVKLDVALQNAKHRHQLLAILSDEQRTALFSRNDKKREESRRL